MELLLAQLDTNIDELLNRHTTSDGEKRQLEEEIERMKQSRFAIKDALDNLQATYDTGIDGLQQAASAYPGVVEKINTAMKDRVNALLTKIQEVANPQPPANPPEGQQGGKKRSGSKHTRGKRHSRREPNVHTNGLAREVITGESVHLQGLQQDARNAGGETV